MTVTYGFFLPISADKDSTYLVRDCVVDSGGVNSETELARSNHCGLIKSMEFDGHTMSGCVLSCQTDGCNAASALKNWSLLSLSIFFVSTMLILRFQSSIT